MKNAIDRRRNDLQSCPASMSSAAGKPVSFFPATGPAPSAARAGFRFGDKGTHSSRTLMFAELEALLAAVPGHADRAEYAAAIIDRNCLGKPTKSTRRHTNQRLGELYSLDRRDAIFRVMRGLWGHAIARRQLALLAALARDPLFLASAAPILALPVGGELQRTAVRDALARVVGERMSAETVDKVVRNVASSWAQTGHLQGRTFKHRKHVEAKPAAVAFALWLGEAAGFRGADLLSSGWIAVLDCTPSLARGLALEAKRAGLIDLRAAGDVFEVGLERLDAGRGR
jgi:hypothetical protein